MARNSNSQMNGENGTIKQKRALTNDQQYQGLECKRPSMSIQIS